MFEFIENHLQKNVVMESTRRDLLSFNGIIKLQYREMGFKFKQIIYNVFYSHYY